MGFWWWSGKPDPNSSKVFLNVRIQNARPRARSVKEQLVTPLSLSPLPSSVRYRSCRSIPSLLNTWELHVPGHQQCLSIPSPKGFLHRGKDRDERDGYGLRHNANIFSHLFVRWHTSHDLSDSQWGSVHFSTQPPKCAAALWCQHTGPVLPQALLDFSVSHSPTLF